MEFKIVKPGNEHYSRVYDLIYDSFPLDEILPMCVLNRRATKSHIDFLVVYDNNQFVGMTYVVTNDEDSICYVFFLAICESERGKGYGTKVLQHLKIKYIKYNSMILIVEEIDEKYDNYDQRLNRLSFYKRNGFKLQGIKTSEQNVVFDVLAYGNPITIEQYKRTMRCFFGPIFMKIYQGPIYEVEK